MPATTRTRATRAPRLPSQQQPGIKGFAKAVKPGTSDSTGKGALPLKKRKLEDVTESDIDAPSSLEVQPTTKLRKAEEPPSRSAESHPHPHSSPGAKRQRRPTASDEVTNEEIASSARCSSSSDTPPNYVESPGYRDLVRLHSSFLQALSLHYTHNGTTAPANIKDLFPTLDRIWKKRKVTTEDIQRLLYLQDATLYTPTTTSSAPKFRICDYGTRYCIERVETEPQSSKEHFKLPLNEADLSAQFAQNLDTLWRQRLGDPDRRDADVAEDIPLAPIHKLDAAAPSQNSARQQLLHVRAGTIRLRAVDPSGKTKDEAAAARKPAALLNRRSGLLERIQAKGADQSKLPPAPSEETILRRSAADRVPEVVNVLLMLSPTTLSGPPKKPFRLHTITQNIQDSMRSPISKREVEACLDMLSQHEVAGDWITVVTVNSLKSVVLRGGRHISPCEIAQRAKNLEL